MTSVGSGSLMIVLLLFTYPALAAGQLVGTDLTQAVPLTAAAALGALLFGHVQFGLTTAVVIGSVPAVLVGSLLSSRAPDKYIRPVITFVIFASGLKYAGMGTTALGWTLCLVLLACGGYWLARNKPWRGGRPADDAPGPDKRPRRPGERNWHKEPANGGRGATPRRTCAAPFPGEHVRRHSLENMCGATPWKTCAAPLPGKHVRRHSLENMRRHSLEKTY